MHTVKFSWEVFTSQESRSLGRAAQPVQSKPEQ